MLVRDAEAVLPGRPVAGAEAGEYQGLALQPPRLRHFVVVAAAAALRANVAALAALADAAALEDAALAVYVPALAAVALSPGGGLDALAYDVRGFFLL